MLNTKANSSCPIPTQHTTTLQWLASLYKIMGTENADKFVRDSAHQAADGRVVRTLGRTRFDG